MSNEAKVNILICDDDLIFRLGLIALIQGQVNSNIAIIAQGKVNEILPLLEQEKAQAINLLLISLDLALNPDKVNDLQALGRKLRLKYPTLPILLITSWGSDKTLENIDNVKGCCLRNSDADELIKAIKICASGGTYFRSSQDENTGLFWGWLASQCQLGLKEIDKNIQEINFYLKQQQLSAVNIIFWQGRRRELKFVRWFIQQISPSNKSSALPSPINNSQEQEPSESEQEQTKKAGKLTINKNEITSPRDIIKEKINGSLSNCTDLILETDILLDKRKKELFLLILKELRLLIRDLSSLDLSVEEINERKSIIIKELWQSSAFKFLEIYWDTSKPENNLNLKTSVTNYSQFIIDNKLIKIPLFEQLLNYLIKEENFFIDYQIYAYGSKEGEEIELILTENTLNIMALSVMQYILNELIEYADIKHNLLKPEWKSSRKIAMFRNNLGWKYRREKYWQNPRNIFEDEYLLLTFAYQGIVKTNLSHPRQEELKQLQGLSWLVTISIELVDSLARGAQSLADIFGKALVYILTEILGKGLGLIAKGILQGIGKKIKN